MEPLIILTVTGDLAGTVSNTKSRAGKLPFQRIVLHNIYATYPHSMTLPLCFIPHVTSTGSCRR